MCTTTAPESPENAALDGARRFRLVTSSLDGRPEGGKQAVDEGLATALASDVEGSFEGLVRNFQDRLYGFAHKLTGNPHDAEEIAQDAFVRAYRALKKYPAQRIRQLALRSWLYQITLNVARNRRRGVRPQFVPIAQTDSASDGAFFPTDSPEDRPDARFEQRQRRADLASLVAALPDRYRTPLILRYVEGLHVEEVAGILKQPLGTTKSNLHRAVNALRAAISESRRPRRQA